MNQNEIIIKPFLSQKLKFWSLISMLCLVFVHGYNLNIRYLQPFTTVEEPLTFNAYFQYFLSNGIFRFRIPLLFCISGYLVTIKFPSTTYKKLVSKRFKTIFLPYLIWSAFGFLFTYCLTLFPYTNKFVIDSGLMWAREDMQQIKQYTWWMVLTRLTLSPIGFHLWFLRTLFYFILAYPAIKWIVTKHVYNRIFFILIGLLWLLEINVLPVGNESLLFFALGIFIAQNDVDIDKPKAWMKPTTWAILFIISAIIKTFLAFNHLPIWGILSQILLHKICVFSGLIFCWYYSNSLVKWFYNKTLLVKLIPHTFFIYVLHVPFVTYAMTWVFSWANHLPHYRFLTYIYLNLLIIFICIILSWVIKRISPKLYSLLTGGRGFA